MRLLLCRQPHAADLLRLGGGGGRRRDNINKAGAQNAYHLGQLHGPLAERIRRDKRERSDRSSDDSCSDQDSCGTGSTSEANDIFDTLDDHLGYGSDSGSGW